MKYATLLATRNVVFMVVDKSKFVSEAPEACPRFSLHPKGRKKKNDIASLIEIQQEKRGSRRYANDRDVFLITDLDEAFLNENTAAASAIRAFQDSTVAKSGIWFVSPVCDTSTEKQRISVSRKPQ